MAARFTMHIKCLMLVMAFLLATTNSFGQEAPLDDVRYGHYVVPVVLGSASFFSVGVLAAAWYWRDEGCQGGGECIDLTFIAAAGVGYLVSVAGGITVATLLGHDKLRIPLYTVIGHSAAIGGLYHLTDRRPGNKTLVSVAAIYILTTPFLTALAAYAIDRSYVRRKSRVQLQPIVSVVANRVSYGFSLRF